MGKRKAPAFRVFYPDAVTTVPSSSTHIHRTRGGRLGGRTYTQTIQDAPTLANEPTEPLDEATNNPWSANFFETDSSNTGDSAAIPIPPRLTRPGTNFLDDYLHYRQSILEHLVELDGRLGSRVCSECLADEGLFRCEDCLYPSLHCAACIVELHKRTPFHRLKVSFHYIDICTLSLNSF